MRIARLHKHRYTNINNSSVSRGHVVKNSAIHSGKNEKVENKSTVKYKNSPIFSSYVSEQLSVNGEIDDKTKLTKGKIIKSVHSPV